MAQTIAQQANLLQNVEPDRSQQTDTRPPLQPNHQPEPNQATLDDSLSSKWSELTKSKSPGQIACKIKEYCVAIVGSSDEQIFVNYFIENKFLQFLHRKMREHASSGQLLRSAFSLLQFLLKALKKQEQLVYFLLKVSQEGFISEGELFKEEEDKAYFANFLKLMVRKINEDHKFITVFLNNREPHFPLLLQLLKIYNCKDTVMRTSSKLAILEISNNRNPLLQKYLHNFPIVLFYPLCMAQVLTQLKETATNPVAAEELESNLKYMEEFVGEKERAAVDMYTNSFLATIARYLYSQIINLQQKNIAKAINLIKVLINHVLPQVTVVKIRTSLFCLFAPTISQKLKKCLQTRTVELDRYWIPQYCSGDVVQHCKALYFKEQRQKSSFFRMFNNYIPKSKGNWLYYQLKKISELIGFQVNLDQPINCQHYKQDSFLEALWSMIDDKPVPNQAFNCIMKTKNEELFYYYLRLLCQLSDSQNVERSIELDRILQTVANCSSLAIVQMFHNLAVKSKLRVEVTPFVDQLFEKVTQKLVHFVLTKGWKELLIHVSESRLPEYDQLFSTDIYREIQCEILLFVGLRTLMGNPNENCSLFNPEEWESYPPSLCETIVKCREGSIHGQQIYLIFDGQYLNLKNKEQQLLNKTELLIQQLQFLQQGERSEVMEIYGSEKSSNFWSTIHVGKNFSQFIMKQVRKRKEMSNRVHLELRQLQFEFKHQ